MNIPTNLQALSIRQPWAWLILHAGKDIENRSWPTRYRGRVLIHAGKGMTKAEYQDAREHAAAIAPHITLPAFEELPRGGIVGEMRIVDCKADSLSPWFFGPYGFVIEDAKRMPFTSCPGALGFFRPKLDQQNLL